MKFPVYAAVALTASMAMATSPLWAQTSKITSASAYIDNGNFPKAYEALQEALQNEKTMNSERTYYQLLRLYATLAVDTTGSYTDISADPLSDGRDAAKKVLELDINKKMGKQVLPHADRLARILYNSGLTAYRAADYETAYRHFLASYDAHGVIYGYELTEGRDTSTYYFASICADLAGRKDVAESMLRELISIGYAEPAIYGNLGKLYMGQEKFAEAEKVLAEGRSKYPASQDLLIDELNFFLQQGRAPEAIDKFQMAIANDPENPELYFALGTAHQALIQLDKENAPKHMADARSAYGKVIELNPTSFDAYLNTGALYYNEGVLLQEEINNVDIREQEKADALAAQQKELYRQALPFFQKAAEVYEQAPEAEKVDVFFAVEVYRSLKEIHVRLGDYDASGKARKRMEELEAIRK